MLRIRPVCTERRPRLASDLTPEFVFEMLCQESLKTGPQDEVKQMPTVGKHAEGALPGSLNDALSFRLGDRPYRQPPDRRVGKPPEESHLLFFPLDLFLTERIYH